MVLTSLWTNNSSIVSKRSVERLYFPNELHFFRYFVKKPQRRSPLINRGYVCVGNVHFYLRPTYSVLIQKALTTRLSFVLTKIVPLLTLSIQWLRMRAIDQVVQQFLEQPLDKAKVVINLGCC
jgi:tRNA wybutosine-synthesizing protein 4